MHDILEGVHIYDMILVINPVIHASHICLGHLNGLVSNLSYSIHDMKNIPGVFIETIPYTEQLCYEYVQTRRFTWILF